MSRAALARKTAPEPARGSSGKHATGLAPPRYGVALADLRRLQAARQGPPLSCPGDAAEREADAAADRVMQGAPAGRLVASAPGISRACAACEDEPVRRQAAGAASPANAPPSVAAALGRPGRPLDPATRAFMEPRFGADFAGVRVHADAEAATAARAIGARAFTRGQAIGFAAGEYAPGSPAGRHLLAHELAHTLQTGDAVRRTCPSDPAAIPPGDDAAFEAAVDTALAHPTFAALGFPHRRIARHIIDGARGSDCPMYYISKLLLMFNTPMGSSTALATTNRAASAQSAATEATRLQAPAAAAAATVQETATASVARRWRRRAGEGATFQIDDHDVANIFVRMCVHLVPRGVGQAQDVAEVRALEDAIEIAASSRGYTLDLEFRDRGGPGVFTIGVDPSKWTVSDNWAAGQGGPNTIAHEAHHLLGLADRYNYIESHATNADMAFGDRLYWFREQMVRPVDAGAPQSMMSDENAAGATINDEDVCALTGARGAAYERCLLTRFTALPLAELERRGRLLNNPYRPQHAALLRLLEDAWEAHPPLELLGLCGANPDPLCGLPPGAAFGDGNITAGDASRFPLREPHRPAAGSTLRRVARRRRP